MATALITGSSRGIGAAIALRLAQDGFNIALNDLNESMFENNEIIEQIKETGVECEYFCADVSNYNQCEEMVNAVKERFGGLDVLVNNAGITKDGLMARMSEEQRNMMLNLIAMKRYGLPEEIAGVVSFLVSKDASYVTGQVIEISGGLSM